MELCIHLLVAHIFSDPTTYFHGACKEYFHSGCKGAEDFYYFTLLKTLEKHIS